MCVPFVGGSSPDLGAAVPQERVPFQRGGGSDLEAFVRPLPPFVCSPCERASRLLAMCEQDRKTETTNRDNGKKVRKHTR